MFDKQRDQIWFPIGIVLLVIGIAMPRYFPPSEIIDLASPFLIGVAIAFNGIAIFQLIKHDREEQRQSRRPERKRK